MKKIDLGQSISILANLGVIAGIAFLAVEINQNSVINRVSSVQEIRQSMQGINLLSMENAAFAALVVKLMNNEELDPIERQQSVDFLIYMYGQSQLAFFQYKNDLIGEADLQQMLEPFVFWMKRNNFMRGMWESGGLMEDDELSDYVNENFMEE
jgi:hypothetical protein